MPKKTYFQVNEEDQQNVITAVQFSHGQLDQTKSSRETKWQMYRKKRENVKRGKDKRIVTAEVGTMSYMGDNFSSSLQTTDTTCDYYIGVLNKDSRKLRVLPAELFHLHPVTQDKVTIKSEILAPQTYREKTDDLTKEFGSGKMQRSLNKRQKNKLDSEMLSTATKSATETTTIVKDEKESDSPAPLVTVTSAVPPHNIDASRPEDVYRVVDIINPGIIYGLDAMAEGLFNSTKEEIAAWEREKTYSQIVLRKLPTLSVLDEARRMQCQCLLYIDCLIKVYVMKWHQLRLKEPLPREWNILVRKQILSVFFVETLDNGKRKRTLPSQKKDLMLSHIIVLCLKLNNFCLNIDDMLADIGIAKKRLITHCQILGCTIKGVKEPGDSSAHMTHFASLTVPLKFPELKNYKSKKAM